MHNRQRSSKHTHAHTARMHGDREVGGGPYIGTLSVYCIAQDTRKPYLTAKRDPSTRGKSKTVYLAAVSRRFPLPYPSAPLRRYIFLSAAVRVCPPAVTRMT